jgi:butyrate kinase
MDTTYILAINPGSTSTKIAVYNGTSPKFIQTLRHGTEELKDYALVTDQFEFRKNIILEQLENEEININSIKIVMGRGGLLKPVESGVIEVNQAMLDDLSSCAYGEHASNLGGMIAYDIAAGIDGARAFIANPVVVDELCDKARFSGHPLFPRKSIFHALNQKAVARQHSKSILRKYEDLNLIVVHLGGGITVGAHKKGRVIDVNQGLDGDGPFSPERSGTLPVGDIVRMCFSGKYSQKEIMKMIKGEGGIVAYLKTNSAQKVSLMAAEGDENAKLVYDAMAYQVAKEVGAMGSVLSHEIDGILITGGIAYDKYFTNQIISYVHRMAPVHIYPGEDEMQALAMNGLRLLRGEMDVRQYK